MDRVRWARLAIGIVVVAAAVQAAAAANVAERVRIPAAHAAGWLAGTLARPAGAGPFPLIVLSHGAPDSARVRASWGYWDQSALVTAFVRRGFAVIVPVRRGFGATGGDYAEDYGGCADPDFYRSGLAAARDILAALRFAAERPFVDGSRVVLVGQSAGGFASLAAASLRPPGLVGVANFAGGRAGDPARRPGHPCHADRMAATIEGFAGTTEVPVLWHYVDNDAYFAPAVARRWFAAFRRGGGIGELVIAPPTPAGHSLLLDPEAERLWGPVFDRFVVRLGIGRRMAPRAPWRARR
ncbi:MAG: prolyl oligopeptidase family serine peptidase [Gammaproteobacteria bacterium]|nr:prolyl oligopeptidase family serine peptidase [Gammaproteobacteria bacterium]